MTVNRTLCLYICSNFGDVIEWTGFRASGARGVPNFGGFIERSRANELDKSIQKLLELRSYAVIRAIKPRRTLLGFVFFETRRWGQDGGLTC